MIFKKLAITSTFIFFSGCALARSDIQVHAPTGTQLLKQTTVQAQAGPADRVQKSLPELKIKRDFITATVIVSNILSRFEYEKLPLDKKMSKKIFDEYFDSLDPQRMFLLQSDIDRFAHLREYMADMILNGRLEIPFEIYSIYRDRVEQRYEEALSLLGKPFDFTIDENFKYDRKKEPWPHTNAEINDLWRQRVKNDFLRLKLAGQSDDKIIKQLTKRYNNNRNQLLKTNSEDVFEIFMNAYAGSTDPHTSYMSPSSAQNFDVQMSLSVEGIGAVLQKRDEYGQIREVVVGGPAAKSGQIQPGDRLIAVGQNEDGAMEDVVDWRLDDIVKKIRGKRGSIVRVELIPSDGGLDGKTKTVTLVRDRVLMQDQAARVKVLNVPSNGGTEKVGVITIPSFYDDFNARSSGQSNFKSVTRDVQKILLDLKQQGVNAVVLDLRANGGGSLREAADLSGLFIGGFNPVVQVSSAEGKIANVRSKAGEVVWDKPVVVLVNRLSASASEIFAAVLQDYGRGIIVGDPTWGKGTVQTVSSLKDFLRDPNTREQLGSLKWTIQKFFRVNGASTQEKGVTPDIAFPPAFNYKELGESSYPNAMKWSEISPIAHRTFVDLSPSIRKLRDLHVKRTAASDSWKLMENELSYNQKLADRKEVSLNLDTRIRERKDMEKQRDEFNQRRKDLGESDFGVFKLDDGLQMGEGNLKQELDDEKKSKEYLDTFAKEAANIAADMVLLNPKF